jgi:hypothetical protein
VVPVQGATRTASTSAAYTSPTRTPSTFDRTLVPKPMTNMPTTTKTAIAADTVAVARRVRSEISTPCPTWS